MHWYGWRHTVQRHLRICICFHACQLLHGSLRWGMVPVPADESGMHFSKKCCTAVVPIRRYGALSRSVLFGCPRNAHDSSESEEQVRVSLSFLFGFWKLVSMRLQARLLFGQQTVDLSHQLQKFFGIAFDRCLFAQLFPSSLICHASLDAGSDLL
jgi:hypothetical protein